jgi:hypothetical protein
LVVFTAAFGVLAFAAGGGAATATALGDEDTWACIGFGMIVEQRSWKSALALVS